MEYRKISIGISLEVLLRSKELENKYNVTRKSLQKNRKSNTK